MRPHLQISRRFPPHFNPRTPCGVRQNILAVNRAIYKFQTTHPLRGATPAADTYTKVTLISIHAPLAGCDQRLNRSLIIAINFNPRTPCGVRRRAQEAARLVIQFQSTHPLRGATMLRNLDPEWRDISIHAPLAGCDIVDHAHNVANFISIHAPLAGCDIRAEVAMARNDHFNPRTPCGVRLISIYLNFIIGKFQSTHPLRGATRRGG